MVVNITPLVSVLLPSWNTEEQTLEFLRSLTNQDYPPKALELIVVDNGSSDGSVASIKEWLRSDPATCLHSAQVITFPANRGIAAAYNAGYAHCSSDSWAVIRAESDIVWDRELVTILVTALLQYEDVGVIGARGGLSNDSSRLDFGARYVNWWTGKMCNEDSDHLVECDCVFGSTFIIRRSCIDQLGYFFPPDRFLADELGFCTRVRRLGYKVLFEPRAKVLHRVGTSTARLNKSRFRYVDAFEKTLFQMELNHFPRNLCVIAMSILHALKHREYIAIVAIRDALLRAKFRTKVLAPEQRPGVSTVEWLSDRAP
jgi:hypothetical protein